MTATVYPSAIQRACAALDEAPVFRDLPDGYWRVVVRIIKKINLSNPSQPIFASRDTLARESRKSVETVHRVIRWLEERGLVSRERRANSRLQGSVSLIVPEEPFLEALGLTARTVCPDASISRQNPVSSKEQPRAPVQTDKTATITLVRTHTCARVGGFSIPEDLVWLTDNGLRPSAVCHLMRLARGFGKRLSDVAAYARPYIEALSAPRAFAYLKSLLPKNLDFAWLSKQQREQTEARVQRDTLSQALETLKGKVLERDDGVRIEVLSGGVLTLWRDGRYLGASHADQSFVEALQSGRLKVRQ